MIRLNSSADLFENIGLAHCALLFLSTPHSGSTEADWNKYLVAIAELGFGIRSNAIVDALRSFNPQSAYRCEDFKNMTLQPPYICFHETRATSVGGLNRQVGLRRTSKYKFATLFFSFGCVEICFSAALFLAGADGFLRL